MPFGLVGAPALFQWLMTGQLSDVMEYAEAHLDDNIISQTLEDHVVYLTTIYETSSKCLTVNISKCPLGMAESSFLEHKVVYGKIRPEYPIVTAVKHFQEFLQIGRTTHQFYMEGCTRENNLDNRTKKTSI